MSWPLKAEIDPIIRFVTKVEFTDICWLWTGAKTINGYGLMWNRPTGGARLAHRFSYEYFRGPIPESFQLDHLCRNRACVNPDHLEVVTQRENILRGENRVAQQARQTHCVHGHPFDERNTYVGRRGRRECRSCHNTRERRRHAAEAIHGN